MATALEVELAARTRKPSKSIDTLDVGKVDLFPDATPEEYSEAREFVKRLANRHDCKGVNCAHPRHAADTAACDTVLDLMGLTRDRLVGDEPDDDPESVAPHTDSRRQHTGIRAAPDHSWRDRAACQGESLWLFFGSDGERAPERELREGKAKEVCSACPVRTECLDYAVDGPNPQKYGFYGGMNEDERAAERRRRQRRAAA